MCGCVGVVCVCAWGMGWGGPAVKAVPENKGHSNVWWNSEESWKQIEYRLTEVTKLHLRAGWKLPGLLWFPETWFLSTLQHGNLLSLEDLPQLHVTAFISGLCCPCRQKFCAWMELPPENRGIWPKRKKIRKETRNPWKLQAKVNDFASSW